MIIVCCPFERKVICCSADSIIADSARTRNSLEAVYIAIMICNIFYFIVCGRSLSFVYSVEP